MEKETQSAHLFRFGVYEIDLESGELRKSGRKVNLQEQPFRVLALLLLHSGKLVTREEIQRRLWPADTFVDFDLGLNTAIKKIRGALGDSADNPKFVETLPKRGYRFICPVEEVPAIPPDGIARVVAVSSDENSVSPQPPPDPTAQVNSGNTPRLGRTRLWAALGIGLLICLLVFWGFKVLPIRTRNTTAAQYIQSIAVLPFTSESKDDEQDFFADGMTEELITNLAQLGWLRVTSHTSVLQYKHQPKPVPQIKDELNVDAIVEGTVTRSGDKVRITAQLIQTATDKHLWAGRYEGNPEDMLVLQSNVARAIAGEIRSTLTREELERLGDHGTHVAQAYDSYLRGLGFLQVYDMPERNDEAIHAFEQAIQADPSYALAYAALGGAYWKKYRTSRDEQWKARAQEACNRALELEPMRPDAHICQGVLDQGMGQYERAIKDFSAAIEIDPRGTNGANAYRGRARAYETLGKLPQAEEDYLQANELDPRGWRGYTSLARLYLSEGRYSEAVAQYENAVKIKPDNSEPRLSLGAVYVETGQYDKALSMLEEAIKLRPSFGAYENRGTAFLYQRRFQEAVQSFEKAIELAPEDYRGYGNLARAYFWSPGRRELAQGSYEQAIRIAKQQLTVNQDNSDINLMLAVYHAMLARKDDALFYLDRAQQLQPVGPETAFWAAVVYFQLGNRAKSLVWLRQARELKYSSSEINNAPELDGLRRDPEFLRANAKNSGPESTRSKK